MVVSGFVKKGQQEKLKAAGHGVVLLNLNPANSRARVVGIVQGADTLRKPFLLQAAGLAGLLLPLGTCGISSRNPLQQPLFKGYRGGSQCVSTLRTGSYTQLQGFVCVAF